MPYHDMDGTTTLDPDMAGFTLTRAQLADVLVGLRLRREQLKRQAAELSVDSTAYRILVRHAEDCDALLHRLK